MEGFPRLFQEIKYVEHQGQRYRGIVITRLGSDLSHDPQNMMIEEICAIAVGMIERVEASSYEAPSPNPNPNPNPTVRRFTRKASS